MMDSKQVIADYWDAAAPAFDDEPDHGLGAAAVRAAWARRLRAWLPGPPADVLDVGCGTGSLALLTAAEGHRVTGFDLAPGMVERARAKFASAGLPGTFDTGDAAAPPVGDRSFDVVLARHLLWTLPAPEATLRVWSRLLRPGGRLVLVEGRWRQAGLPGSPYGSAAGDLPWSGGVGAEQLSSVVRSMAGVLRVDDLASESELWGGEAHDERYALIARV